MSGLGLLPRPGLIRAAPGRRGHPRIASDRQRDGQRRRTSGKAQRERPWPAGKTMRCGRGPRCTQLSGRPRLAPLCVRSVYRSGEDPIKACHDSPCPKGDALHPLLSCAALALPTQPPSGLACPALPVTLHGGASLGVSLVAANPVCAVHYPPRAAQPRTIRYATPTPTPKYMIALASPPPPPSSSSSSLRASRPSCWFVGRLAVPLLWQLGKQSLIPASPTG